MEINKTKRWFYGLTLLWVVMLLGLGSWWLFLVFKLSSTLNNIHLPELGSQERFLNMMKWEGSFFFIFLVLLGGSLFYMYFRDMKKTKAMQAFFSSLSHELKTPLASMRLQVEVIKDLIDDESHDHAQLSNLTKRLIEDTFKLESELEKSLQLSRIEGDGVLSLVPIGLDRYLKRHAQKQAANVKIKLDIPENAAAIFADELALNVIFRNLFENTLRHNPNSKEVLISTRINNSSIELIYDDQGESFSGNTLRLGELFYKHNSTKGSGIGLYLIKNLMRKMQGQFIIKNENGLKQLLVFKKAQEEQDV